jgi:hypothetical protein
VAAVFGGLVWSSRERRRGHHVRSVWAWLDWVAGVESPDHLLGPCETSTGLASTNAYPYASRFGLCRHRYLHPLLQPAAAQYAVTPSGFWVDVAR